MVMGSPGRIPPAINVPAAGRPTIQEWDPHGDIYAPENGAEVLYVPPGVLAPPQTPTPEQHPKRQQFPARGVKVLITDASKDLSPGSQLGFTASSVQVDNFSNQWLFLPSAQRWIPPGMFGLILPIVPGTQVAEYRILIPTGHANGTVGTAASPVVTIWFEDDILPSIGIILTV